MSHEEPDNRARHLILDRENVMYFAVIPLGPAVGAGHGIDELRRNADAITAPLDASLQYVPCAQLPADLPDIDRLALVLEARIARDDQELGEPRQLGDDVISNAVAEIVLLRVAAEVCEG